MASVFTLTIVVAACTADSRYRVLTVFFEGVPAPGETEEDTSTATSPPLPETAQERAALLGYRVAVPEFSSHDPYREGRCEDCHQGNKRDLASTSWAAGSLALRSDPRRLCFSCHEVPAGSAQVHGPVALGECLLCHVPHQSPHPSLLRSADTDSICKDCHQPGSTFVSYELHEGFKDRTCVECHDPHWSSKLALLR